MIFYVNNKRQLPTTDAQIEQQMEPCYDSYENPDLEDALTKLSFYEQTVLRLKYFEEMTFTQIASVMDENVNTVKTKLYRTLDTLKISLNEKEI